MSTSIKTFRDTEIQIRLLQDKIKKLQLDTKRTTEEIKAEEPTEEIHVHFDEVDSELTSDGSTVVHKLHHKFKSAEFESVTGLPGGGGGSFTQFVTSALVFDGQTANGTTNPHDWDIVYLTDSPYTCIWVGHWEFFAHGIRCYPPQVSSWSWINQGGALVNTNSKVAIVTKSLTTSDQIHMWTKPITMAAPYMVTAILVPEVEFSGFPACGIFIASSLPRIHTIGPSFNSTPSIRGYRYAAPNVPAGVNDVDLKRSIDPVPIWFRMYNDGTNIQFSFSYNGTTFTPLVSIALSAYILTANQWGIFVNAMNALETSVQLLSWQEIDL